MNLVIGGTCQNKCQVACELFHIEKKDIADGEVCEMDEIFYCKAINHFHLYIRRLIREGQDTEKLIQNILAQNPDILLISDEIGYGIVPMDAGLRKWRECTGRICCEAAAASEKVVRVIAGRAQTIKGE
ncbi:MAG: bifunctional adenosylcobinamide kinase/adenosylcobinamide-phosphate guanylyltransferase [Eubacteriales bacterium]|nr:bifunctional adenosylcobinamide kinase/adenosylcobinamide-phosphate guanylyltransferase [Eubacteriales bacterium]